MAACEAVISQHKQQLQELAELTHRATELAAATADTENDTLSKARAMEKQLRQVARDLAGVAGQIQSPRWSLAVHSPCGGPRVDPFPRRAVQGRHSTGMIGREMRSSRCERNVRTQCANAMCECNVRTQCAPSSIGADCSYTRCDTAAPRSD